MKANNENYEKYKMFLKLLFLFIYLLRVKPHNGKNTDNIIYQHIPQPKGGLSNI